MNNLTKILILAIAIFSNSLTGFSQLVGTNVNKQDSIEVRKDSTVIYSVAVGHISGEQYSWEIIGGTPTPAASSGSGTIADPYIINFTPNLTSISVRWNADDHTITSQTGRIRVQKKNTTNCISTIQDLKVFRWSAASAVISSDLTNTICNGENTGYVVTVQFTGAPNFDLDYTIENNLTGTPVVTNQTLTNVTSGTVNITIPDNLINTTSEDRTYKIILKRMNDAFTGDGNIPAATGTYTLTVHPASALSPITVSPGSLIRRP